DQVIGHVSYVIELQETNLQRSREVTTEILKVLEAQMDTLKASKLQLTTCLTRSAMVKAQTSQEIYMVAENIRTIEDQIQGITAGLGKLIEAHGTLKYQSELPLIWPSAKDYIKPQADETKNIEDIECKLRVARREEIAKNEHKEIFDVGRNQAWDKNKPETWHAYGWKDYEVWPDYNSVNTSQAQVPEMPGKQEDTWTPPVGYAKRKMGLASSSGEPR
ncbi:unnamed protein product, partial [Prorocentrum cordatum]